MNTAQVNINEIDLSFSATNPIRGISGVLGITKRGPFNTPSILITSWEAFVKLYGGLVPGNDFPLLCKRALERGTALRVARIGNYTDPSNASTLTAVLATFTNTSTVSIDVDLIASNTISVTIGSAVTQIFTTNSQNTLELLAAKLRLLSTVYSVVVGTKKLTITPNQAQVSNLVTAAGVTGGASQPTTSITMTNNFKSAAGNNLFALTLKYPGVDYNNVVAEVTAPSNGTSGYFNLNINFIGDSTLNESYKNLKIVGTPSIAQSTYLSALQASKLVNVTYYDLSALTAQLTPVYTSLRAASGTDGSAVVAADYIGDAAGSTGFHSFNNQDDLSFIAAPDLSTASVHVAGAAYAQNRKDLVYFGHLSNASTTEAALVAERDALVIDSSYAAFFAGGLIVADPFTGADKQISELGDILGAAAYSDKKNGPWYSFAGTNRGIITNALGVVNNFGAASNTAGLNTLANRQINLVINRGGRLMIQGNFSAQVANSHLSFLSVRKLLIEIRKSLQPLLYNYLEEPNDIPTWKNIWMAGSAKMDELITKRAIFSYDWQGDQFADSIDNLEINNATDVGNGIYKIRLFIKDIASLQDIQVDIVITQSAVSFEDALGLV